jgi:hypothetical protein
MADPSYSFLILLAAVLMGAVLALTGAALGGLLVFKTRKEPGASLFNTRAERGDAFILDDYEGGVEEQPIKGRDQKGEDPVPSIVAKQTELFLSQLKNAKGPEI